MTYSNLCETDPKMVLFTKYGRIKRGEAIGTLETFMASPYKVMVVHGGSSNLASFRNTGSRIYKDKISCFNVDGDLYIFKRKGKKNG